MPEYTHIVPHGGGWLRANPSVIGTGLWVKTTEHGVVLPDDEIPALVEFLQKYQEDREHREET